MERSNSRTPTKYTEEQLRQKIKELASSTPSVHLTLNHARKKLKDQPVRIKAIHNHFFTVEHDDGGYVAKYTVRFDELLTGEIGISELV